MSEHWQEVQLGEVLTQRRTRTKVSDETEYPLLGVRWYGEGPFLRETVTSQTSKATSLYEVKAGDFIYNRLFAWKGSFGIIDKNLAGSFVSGEFPLFQVDERRLDRRFLNYLMCRPVVWEQIEIESTGSTKTSRNRWKEEAFLSFSVKLPPLAEQRRIVDVVGSIDSYISALEDQLGATRAARAALLYDLLSHPGDDWQETTLGDLTVLVKRGRAPSYSEHGLLVLNQKCVRPGNQIDYSLARRTDPVLRPVPDWAFVNEGDVLINSTGTGTAGRAAIVRGAAEPMTVDSHITIVRANQDVVLPALLGIRMSSIASDLEELASGSTNQIELSRQSIAAITVALPPLVEQRRIVDVVGSFDVQVEALQSQVEAARRLRSGVLSELLSGERLLDESYDVVVGS